MFSGIGGIEDGINRATDGEWDCVGFSEIDKYAIQTYKVHFPKHKNYGDATKIKPEELPDFEFLCGGFPCQSFSIAGKRRGFEDTRGTLFFEIARVLKVKQPRMFLLENVKGLLNHDKGETFTKILQSIDELGYNAEWQVLNSKHFGVPQNRERVFIIGHLRGSSGKQIFPIKYSGGQDIEIKGYLNEKGWDKRHENIRRVYGTEGAISPTIPTGTGGGVMTKIEVKPVLTPNRPEKRQNGRRFKEYGEEMFTLTGQDIHGVMIGDYRYDEGVRIRKDNICPTIRQEMKGQDVSKSALLFKGTSIRRLTPTECERLQGFPDGWTLGSDTQRYKQCGNAVTVNVIEAIINEIQRI